MSMYERPILADRQQQIPALPGEARWMPVCGLSQLISQTIVCARVTAVDLILIWNDGRAVACERICPHEQADLSLGHLSAGRLFCPRHAASFDLRDGRISFGWPSRPLRMYPVRIEDGQVWIDAEAIASSAV
jgi:3-phenylpropionate/trans-cinnamate dioxygenase ferredoxin subunit